jgi:hypothetical protein
MKEIVPHRHPDVAGFAVHPDSIQDALENRRAALFLLSADFTPRNSGLEALGRENRGHVENALVILLLLELRAGFSVDNESNVAMKLQGGGGH